MLDSTSPIIGVTSTTILNKAGSTLCAVGQAYINAIQKAGGLPLVIPIGTAPPDIRTLTARLDGLLLTGGGDIEPHHFGGENHPKISGIVPERDRLEFTLLNLALEMDLPLLAICRGIQVLNVGLGGTLYTHIQDQLPNAVKHDWYPDYPRDRIAHTVSVSPDSKLGRIFGESEVPVNSLHHQGIEKLGHGLRSVASAPDGLVEAVEVIGAGFAMGVQWHPECLPDSLPMQKLFSAFVEACRTQTA
jgi:putative glutamine amidotransferase